jgi:hypothetical protein
MVFVLAVIIADNDALIWLCGLLEKHAGYNIKMTVIFIILADQN